MNIRHASINFIDTRYLFSLEYIDIAFSKLKYVNLLSCTSLNMLIADKTQVTIVAHAVKIEIIYDTVELLRKSKVSLGSATKIMLEDKELIFEDHIIIGYS